MSKNVTISLKKCLRISHELHVLSRDRSRANPPLQPPDLFFFFFLGVSNWKGGRARRLTFFNVTFAASPRLVHINKKKEAMSSFSFCLFFDVVAVLLTSPFSVPAPSVCEGGALFYTGK